MWLYYSNILQISVGNNHWNKRNVVLSHLLKCVTGVYLLLLLQKPQNLQWSISCRSRYCKMTSLLFIATLVQSAATVMEIIYLYQYHNGHNWQNPFHFPCSAKSPMSLTFHFEQSFSTSQAWRTQAMISLNFILHHLQYTMENHLYSLLSHSGFHFMSFWLLKENLYIFGD